MSQTIYIEVWTKKYPLVITPCTELKDIEAGAIHVVCEATNINQDYLKEDLALLLEDLPEMIKDSLSEKKGVNIPIRFSSREKLIVEEKAKQNWFKNISSFIRAKVL